MKYRVEVATDSTFSPSAVIDTAEVDQTTYTAPRTIYPNRKYWWRVQAIDSDGNGLDVVDAGDDLQPDDAADHPVAPVNNVNAAGTTAFRWQAQAYAKGYNIEIYKNDDSDLLHGEPRRLRARTCPRRRTPGTSRLAPSATAYRWRVRRHRLLGRPGRLVDRPVLRHRRDAQHRRPRRSGSIQATDGPVLEWEPLAGAATLHRHGHTLDGGSAVIANTVSTAWAVTTSS